MRRTLATALMLTLVATAAQAQFDNDLPAPLPDRGRARGEGPPGGGPRQRLFISPSGEPFRGAEDGLAAWLAKADTNHDGAVSLEEFSADAKRAFKLYDTNGDGVVDGFEIGAYETAIVPEIAQFEEEGGGGRFLGGGRGRRGGGAPALFGNGQRGRAAREGAARYSLLNEPQPLAAGDEDLDGRISALEWAHITARRFARLDTEKTGLLTHDSLRPAQPIKKK